MNVNDYPVMVYAILCHLFTNNPSRLFQINPLIDGQTAAQQGPDARGPQLPRHVMPAC
jgi:hypothetical protein